MPPNCFLPQKIPGKRQFRNDGEPGETPAHAQSENGIPPFPGFFCPPKIVPGPMGHPIYDSVASAVSGRHRNSLQDQCTAPPRETETGTLPGFRSSLRHSVGKTFPAAYPVSFRCESVCESNQHPRSGRRHFKGKASPSLLPIHFRHNPPAATFMGNNYSLFLFFVNRKTEFI